MLPCGQALGDLELDQRGAGAGPGLVAADLPGHAVAQEAAQHLEVAEPGLGLGQGRERLETGVEIAPRSPRQGIERALVEGAATALAPLPAANEPVKRRRRSA